MLLIKNPQDFVIATGEANSLESFIQLVFTKLGLNYKNYLIIDESLFRPNEIMYSCGNPSRAKNVLNWSPKIKLELLVEKLILSELEKTQC